MSSYTLVTFYLPFFNYKIIILSIFPVETKSMLNDLEKQISSNRRFKKEIEKALLDTFFSDWDKNYLKTEEGKNDIETNAFKRYEHSVRYIVPWLLRHIDLQGKKVLEVGCGTGSSTAALAHFVDHIKAYDIHDLSVKGAQKRLDIMGLKNADFHVADENNIVTRITQDAKDHYDIILLFAVLEHQTIEERHDTLSACWGLLKKSGIMVVIDTPNLLHYFDLHTSKLPFLHLLPDKLYAKYAKNSPRVPFAKSFSDSQKVPERQLDNDIARWGRGVSYHDFEIVLGHNYKDLLVADGFEPEILEWFDCTPEEEILRWYVQYKKFDIPLGFTRCVLNLIFKKFSTINESSRYSGKRFSPPPPTHFQHNPIVFNERLQQIENALESKTDHLNALYSSKTWRLASLMAGIYRRMKLFSK